MSRLRDLRFGQILLDERAEEIFHALWAFALVFESWREQDPGATLVDTTRLFVKTREQVLLKLGPHDLA